MRARGGGGVSLACISWQHITGFKVEFCKLSEVPRPSGARGAGRGWVDTALVGAESKGGDRARGWRGVEASKCESDPLPSAQEP